jgi:hypothetical protein
MAKKEKKLKTQKIDLSYFKIKSCHFNYHTFNFDPLIYNSSQIIKPNYYWQNENQLNTKIFLRSWKIEKKKHKINHEI